MGLTMNVSGSWMLRCIQVIVFTWLSKMQILAWLHCWRQFLISAELSTAGRCAGHIICTGRSGAAWCSFVSLCWLFSCDFWWTNHGISVFWCAVSSGELCDGCSSSTGFHQPWGGCVFCGAGVLEAVQVSNRLLVGFWVLSSVLFEGEHCWKLTADRTAVSGWSKAGTLHWVSFPML